MMCLDQIHAESNRAAREAARTHRVPYAPFSREEVEAFARFPFPKLGNYRPKGWMLVESLLCDATGLGACWEPALTVEQLKKKLVEHVESDKDYGYGVIEVGQFQVVLGVFERRAGQGSRARRSRPS